MATHQIDRCSTRPERGWCSPTGTWGRAPLPRCRRAARCCDWPWNLRQSLPCPPIHRSRGAVHAAGLRPPTRPRGSVARPRLVRRLSRGTRGSIRAARRPCRLRQDDTALGMGRVATGADSRGSTSAQATMTPTGCSPRSGGRCTTPEPPTVLVVDNAHLVSTPGDVRRPRRGGALDAVRFAARAGVEIRAGAARWKPASASEDLRAAHR